MCWWFQTTERHTSPVWFKQTQLGPSERTGNILSQQTSAFKTRFGSKGKNVVSQSIKHQKKTFWFPLTYFGYSCHAQGSRQKIANPVWETESCKDKLLEFKTFLKDDFQDTNSAEWQQTSSNSVSVRLLSWRKPAPIPPGGGGFRTSIRPPEQTVKPGWKKSPHPGLEHVFQAASPYAALTKFHCFWQVDDGRTCQRLL